MHTVRLLGPRSILATVPRAQFPLQMAAPHGVAFTGRTAAAAEKEAEGRIRSRCPQRKKHPDRLLSMEEQR